MRQFARLFMQLDSATAVTTKLASLKNYLQQVSGPEQLADAAWGVYFLAGGKPRQTIPTKLLRETARKLANDGAGIPEWLFDESYDAVGDLAETIAHLLPPPTATDDTGLAEWVEQRLLPLKGAAPEVIAQKLREYWSVLNTTERYLLTKLISGGFRIGVSKQLVVRALGEFSGVDPKRIAQRMVGWTNQALPTAERFAALIAPAPADSADDGPTDHEDSALPYPFFLAHPLQAPVETLGDREQWLVEWKWDGIRAQIVKRAGHMSVWSRGEDLMTDRFPEFASFAALPDGTVLDGEIVVWKDDAPAPFAALQTRINRKTVGKKLLADAPVVFLAYDLLEEQGADLRAMPQQQRRSRLEALIKAVALPANRLVDASSATAMAASALDDGMRSGVDSPSLSNHLPAGRAPIEPVGIDRLRLSPLITEPSWQALATLRAESRARGVEGFMLKHRDAAYGVGRTKDVGTWWKWKIDPLTIDAVLLYAQAGHGRRASLYTDYTFAVWDSKPDGERVLVPFAKAYSGLTDAEIKEIDAVIRKTTIEKFGPVRSVKPTLVMELGFEAIQRSPRHKSGVAVRFPRILRLRPDKPVEQADELSTLFDLLV